MRRSLHIGGLLATREASRELLAGFTANFRHCSGPTALRQLDLSTLDFSTSDDRTGDSDENRHPSVAQAGPGCAQVDPGDRLRPALRAPHRLRSARVHRTEMPAGSSETPRPGRGATRRDDDAAPPRPIDEAKLEAIRRRLDAEF